MDEVIYVLRWIFYFRIMKLTVDGRSHDVVINSVEDLATIWAYTLDDFAVSGCWDSVISSPTQTPLPALSLAANESAL